MFTGAKSVGPWWEGREARQDAVPVYQCIGAVTKLRLHGAPAGKNMPCHVMLVQLLGFGFDRQQRRTKCQT